PFTLIARGARADEHLARGGAPRARGDTDEHAVIEPAHVRPLLHGDAVRAIERVALERDAQLLESRAEAAPAGELRDDDAPRRPADALGRHDLVVARVLEDAVLMDARGVRERVRADDRLVRLHRDAGELGVQATGRNDALGTDARVRLVVIAPHAQRHDDLLERRVAAALADAVHADLDLVRAGLDRGQRVRDREAEVVMAVDRDAEAAVVRRERAAHREHGLRELFRLRVADGVGDVHDARAGARHLLIHRHEVVDVGPRRVLRRELDLVRVLGRAAHRSDRAIDALAIADAEHPLEMDLARADEDVNALAWRRSERAGSRIDVAVGRARERRDHRAA